MKVTTEKKPRSILELTVELDKEQIEKALDRAARRMSQKYNIPGFRKGKAPRFIVENYFGRAALLEEASDDLINRAFQDALKQEGIEPYAQAHLTAINLETPPFTFTVEVPMAPTIELPDYRAIRVPFEPNEVTDDMVNRAMELRRDRHVVLRSLEEPRPAQRGDQLTVQIETYVDGEPLEPRAEGEEIPQSTLVLDPERIVPGLYEALLGVMPNTMVDVTVHMADDHENERVRGKDVRFVVNVLDIQERLLPEWDELPALENFEGTLDELREKTRQELSEAARKSAEDRVFIEYVRQVVAATTFDLPDALIEREADSILREREAEYERYGIRPEQIYEAQGKKRADWIEQLKPAAEERAKRGLVLREIAKAEGLAPDDAEIAQEIEDIVASMQEEQRESARAILGSELRPFVAAGIVDRKLRRRILAIATGDPSFEQRTVPAAVEAMQEAATEASSAAAGDQPVGDADAIPSAAPAVSEKNESVPPATDGADVEVTTETRTE
ncbi:MAG: trigger factor [Roseiflexus sp.]|nr:trigger factor [Roseiflexus sp.]MCS7288608.1 trigger factor [Roseiflexus sp.]MDW8146489.1 trigger factor [Roseiflexaceae bacterium]MDW8231231.1 trigger factor [Roseiflexaceae bacterium]